MKTLIRKLFDAVGGCYSKELNINLKERDDNEIFKWFIASLLFGARIGENIAKNTYFSFTHKNILFPKGFIQNSREDIVTILDEGGYARYDFKTATKLISASKNLINNYNGSLNNLYYQSKNEKDLEKKIKALAKGIGPVTTNIFLRELRDIWKKTKPPFSRFTIYGAQSLGIKDLRKIWEENRIEGFTFADFESAFLKLGKNFCLKKKCKTCPVKNYCIRKIQ
jgi:endonuclease III